MSEAGELEIRSVEISFSDAEKVYVTAGLKENEQLIVTDIAAPVQGMPLRVAPNENGVPEATEVARQNGGNP